MGDREFPDSPKRPGRPRVWSSEVEKHRGHRARRRKRARRVDELLHAVRNAHWEEADLQAIINRGDDLQVLEALIAHYRARHWMLRYRQASEGSRREE